MASAFNFYDHAATSLREIVRFLPDSSRVVFFAKHSSSYLAHLLPLRFA